MSIILLENRRDLTMHRQILLVNDGGVNIGENIVANINDTERIKLCFEII